MTATTNKIKIGIIGTGFMGQNAHLQNYMAIDTCEVTAICELKPELRQRVADRFGIKHTYENHSQMLDEQELDGLVVIQNFGMHGSILPPIYEYGLPLITEKPLAGSVEIGKQLIEKMAAKNVKAYVAYHKRSDPAIVEACNYIEQWKQSGQFGNMSYVRVSMPPGDWIANGGDHVISTDEPYPLIENDPKPAGMSDEEHSHLTAFVNYYIHQVNLLRHLLGEDYQVNYGDPNQHVIVTQSDSGVTGLLETNTHSTTVDWQEIALVCFDHAWIKVELPAPLAMNRPGRLTVFRDPSKATPGQGGHFEPMLPNDHAMKQQARFFIEAIQGQATPLCTPEEALKDLQIALDYRAFLNR